MPPEAFALTPTAYIFAFVLGTAFGSFANVCIYRLPEGLSIATPASRCGACGTPIRWYDNLPVVSYLVLRGRCRACGAHYAARYLLVELVTGLLVVAAYHYVVVLHAADVPIELRLGRFAVYALFILVLVVIAMIDLDHQLILDAVTYPAIPVFYVLGLALPDRTWSDGLIGVVVGYGVVRALADGYRLLAGREGMGYGDGKLLALIGAAFGWPAVMVALFGGAVLGTAIAVPRALLARGGGSVRHKEIPFGPYLAAGAVLYLFIDGWIQVTVMGPFGGLLGVTP